MLDARPFRILKVGDSRFKAATPQVRPLSLGVTTGANGVVADQATHTIDVYVGLTPETNALLMDNALVLVNDTAPDVFSRYRILRNGVARNAGVWTLYVRAEDAMTATPETVDPIEAPSTPVPTADDWYMP